MENSTKKILIGAGIVAALLFLLKKKKPTKSQPATPSIPSSSAEIPIVTPEGTQPSITTDIVDVTSTPPQETPIVYPTTPLFNSIDIPFDTPLNVPVFNPNLTITEPILVQPVTDTALIPNTYQPQEQPIVTPAPTIVTDPIFPTFPTYVDPIFISPTPIVEPLPIVQPTPTPTTTTTTQPTPTPTITSTDRSILIRAMVTDVYSNPYSFQNTSPILSASPTLYYSKNNGPKVSLGMVTSTYCTQHSVLYAKDNDVITFSTDSNRNIIAILGSSCPSPSYSLSSGMNSVKIMNGQVQIALSIQ